MTIKLYIYISVFQNTGYQILTLYHTCRPIPESSKSIYDPCPAGWRVPDGGGNGVWSKSLSSTASYSYDSANEGYDFSEVFGSSSTIWYPASGYRSRNGGSLYDVGSNGYYWSASPNDKYAYYLYFIFNGNVDPSSFNDRADGDSVRCLQVID